MPLELKSGGRVVAAVHGRQEICVDPEYERGLSEALQVSYGAESLMELYGRFVSGNGFVDALMRRAIWRSLTRTCGHGLQVGSGVCFRHPETFEIGNGVFIGAQANIQGRFDGRCFIGDQAWIGPQAFIDARDVMIGAYVGFGPGAKILGSTHTGVPVQVPVVRTDLTINPVRIEDWADIGTNATILPGVTIGKGAIVGAGAVVAEDVAPFSVVAGVPAKFLYWRSDERSNQDNQRMEQAHEK